MATSSFTVVVAVASFAESVSEMSMGDGGLALSRTRGLDLSRTRDLDLSRNRGTCRGLDLSRERESWWWGLRKWWRCCSKSTMRAGDASTSTMRVGDARKPTMRAGDASKSTTSRVGVRVAERKNNTFL